MDKALLFAGAALALAGCASSTDSTPGPFAGANGAEAASQITRSGSAFSGETLSTGASANAMVSATISILARHPITVQQKKVAVERARAAVAHLSARPGHRQLPRYIAVDTVKDAHTVPQAQKAVVIWDTQAADVVGNNVYDIANPPAVGATSRFETYSAEYVGAGL